MLSAGQALAAGGEPAIVSESATGIAEHNATLEAQIDPEGLETSYAFWLGHEVCTTPAVGYEKQCYISVAGPLGEGHIAAGDVGQAMSTVVTGLEVNTPYAYTVTAVSAAGHVLGVEKQFRKLAAGGVKTEGAPIENEPTPFERPYEAWVGSRAEEGAAIGLASVKRKEEEREAANKLPAATPLPKGEFCSEEGVACEKGEVMLSAASIVVRGGGMALVKLDCHGTEYCAGKLILSMKTPSTAKGGKKQRSRTIAIGSTNFSIVAGMTTLVKLSLNAAGRALLSADHGRLNAAGLTILKSSPAPSQKQTEDVDLVQQKAHGKTRK